MNVGVDQAGNEVAAGPVNFLHALKWPLADCFDTVWATHAHANSATGQEIQCVNDQT